MKAKTKKTQRSNVRYYLDNLKGMANIRGSDLLELIEEAKAVKSMIVSNVAENPNLLRYYKGICDVILDCYDRLPAEERTSEEKTSIEQAMDILFGDLHN